MILYIADDKKIEKYYFQNTNDNFLFKYIPSNIDIEYFFNIFYENDKWYFKNEDNFKIKDPDNITNDPVLLKENTKYPIDILGYESNITMYCCDSNPSENRSFQIKSSETTSIFIGNGKECQIFESNLLDYKDNVRINLEKDKWYLLNNDNPNCHLYLNNKKIEKKELKRGDIIFINGIRIIWMNEFIKILDTSAVKVRRLAPIKNPTLSHYIESTTEEENLNLYEESDYFYHKPYLKDTVKTRKVVIDYPPKKEIREDLPAWLSIGSRITMVAFSFVMVLNAYNTYLQTQDFASTIPSLLIAGAMIIGCLIFPALTSRYQKKQSIKKEKLRQEKYSSYLSEKVEEIKQNLSNEKNIMLKNNPNARECYEILKNKKNKIWNRIITDDDFLSIRVGIGTLPSTLIVEAPKKHFELYDDNLFETVYKVSNDSKNLYDVPITTSLLKNNISSIISDVAFKDIYINGLILQLLTNHSGKDLKIIVMTSDENKHKWNYLKNATHCWNDQKTFRYFATNLDEMKEISTELEKELSFRRDQDKQTSSKSDFIEDDPTANKKDVYKNFKTYYLIIIDNYKDAKSTSLINDLTEIKRNFGFSLLFITNSIQELPNSCSNFIYVNEQDKVTCVLNKNENGKTQINFKPEYYESLNLNKAISIISNIPIQSEKSSLSFPANISFLEMYHVGRIEQLNILNRWQTSNPINSLQAPIGVYSNGDLLKLDLHEKSHGPHGLIAGSTGSGKSEFLITYIISMAVNYHPDYVQFVLIDYKGGGLAGTFESRDTNKKIPHIAGTITNLDTSSINRALISINSELTRRQEEFNKAKNLLGESTIDIYKYQKYYQSGVLKEPIPHLIIISDEFAELKQQQPDFMQQLISTARIGRSLGVHLILSTQKPSGVVNEQIWSNSRFKVCLRVQSKSDSIEMLKRPEAANIKEIGRFYLQVGNNEIFEEGQSAWTGAPYVPADKIVKKVDNSIDFIDNIGHSILKVDNITQQKNINQNGEEQLTSLVNYLIKLADEQQINSRTLWLEPLSKEIFITDLKAKYNFQPTLFQLEAIIGEYDNPSKQQQGLASLNITQKGHVAIYGATGSGKENLIHTFISSLCIMHSPLEVNFYLVDFASETMKMFSLLPHVGDVVYSNENEKIHNLFTFIEQEINARKALFEDYMGSYEVYNSKSQKKLPQIVIVISGYDRFIEINEDYRDSLTDILRESSRYGIYFIISTTLNNAIGYRITQLFPNKICLQLQDNMEYRNLIGAARNQIPSNIFGRGLMKIHEEIFEFQTAILCKQETFTQTIENFANEYNKTNPYKATSIKVLPSSVLAKNMIKDGQVTSLRNIPIGIYKDDLTVVKYDFMKFKVTPIITNFLDEKISFINALVEEISSIPNTVIQIVDCLNLCTTKWQNINTYTDNFDMVLQGINSSLDNDNTSTELTVYIFVGISQLKKSLKPENVQLINTIFKKIVNVEKSIFIIADSYNTYRSIESEPWYSSSINNTNGIWLGDEINNQLSFKISNLNYSYRNKDSVFSDMAYIIHNGKQALMKHIVDKSKEDYNE